MAIMKVDDLVGAGYDVDTVEAFFRHLLMVYSIMAQVRGNSKQRSQY